MTIEERLKYFIDNFDLITSGVYSRGPKKKISDGEDRLCRFCHKTKQDTTFKNESHAIPECLGNHQLILLDECDSCNKFFSEQLEDHLDKFTKPFRIAGQIIGKNGIPEYRTNNKRSKITFVETPLIQSPIGEEFLSVDKDKKEITLKLHQEKHIPIAVYKTLIKIAISIIETKNELANFKATIDWVRSDNIADTVIKPAILMQTFIPGPRPTNGVVVSLFRRKPDAVNVPYAILVMGFGNLVFQIIVPSGLDDGITMNIHIPFFPSPFELGDWPFGEIKYSSIDLSGTEKASKEFPLIYSFESMVQVDPLNLKPC